MLNAILILNLHTSSIKNHEINFAILKFDVKIIYEFKLTLILTQKAINDVERDIFSVDFSERFKVSIISFFKNGYKYMYIISFII